jgi:hypothetical protein
MIGQTRPIRALCAVPPPPVSLSRLGGYNLAVKRANRGRFGRSNWLITGGKRGAHLGRMGPHGAGMGPHGDPALGPQGAGMGPHGAAWGQGQHGAAWGRHGQGAGAACRMGLAPSTGAGPHWGIGIWCGMGPHGHGPARRMADGGAHGAWGAWGTTNPNPQGPWPRAWLLPPLPLCA